MTPTNTQQSGFALLITLIVVSVIVAVTAAIIELSIKQLELSVTARDSEIAFHAANAGAECVRYIQRVSSSSLLLTSAIQYNCFGLSGVQNLTNGAHGVTISRSGAGYVTRRFTTTGTGATWNSDRCTQIDILVINVSLNANFDQVVSNLNRPSGFPGYTANGGTKTCRIGSTCYVAQVTGYNNPCGSISSEDTVRREVLLEF